MAANDLQTIDVLSSPYITSRIDCFDIAEGSKDVVCYSSLFVEGKGVVSRSLVVFGLQDTSYLAGVDQKVTENLNSLLQGVTRGGRGGSSLALPRPQHLKWKAYWRCDESLLAAMMAIGTEESMTASFISTLSLSPLGDVMVMGANESLSLWTRDSNMSTHSYSMHLFYSKDEPPKGLYAQCLEQRDIGQIIQSEFTRDSRAFLTLEQDNQSKQRSVNVWYNPALRSLRDFDPRKEYKPSRTQPDDPAQYRPPEANQYNLESLERFTLPRKENMRSRAGSA